MIRVTAVATGTVQGVGYRQFVYECARQMGIHGSVQNMTDGSVHIVAEGSPAALDDFVRHIWAKESRFIRVVGLQVARSEATGEFKGFWVKW